MQTPKCICRTRLGRQAPFNFLELSYFYCISFHKFNTHFKGVFSPLSGNCFVPIGQQRTRTVLQPGLRAINCTKCQLVDFKWRAFNNHNQCFKYIKVFHQACKHRSAPDSQTDPRYRYINIKKGINQYSKMHIHKYTPVCK